MPGSENSTEKFHYVYLLQSLKNKELYVGFTYDLRKRLRAHNKGLVFSTKPYRPWYLLHYEAYRNVKDAERREKYLKTNQGSRLLKRMLKEYFYARNR
jgi:putative endonuclease